MYPFGLHEIFHRGPSLLSREVLSSVSVVPGTLDCHGSSVLDLVPLSCVDSMVVPGVESDGHLYVPLVFYNPLSHDP